MNQEAINNLPEHLKPTIATLDDDLLERLFPDVEINWNYINKMRENIIHLALYESPYKLPKHLLANVLWSIKEFIYELMQNETFDDIYYEYDALTDVYTIYYVITEESENE